MPASELKDGAAAVFACTASFSAQVPPAPEDLAKLLNHINFFQPFPEGNGRAQRIFLSLLAKQCGYDLSWDLVQPWEMVEVCRQGYMLNLDPMIALFSRIMCHR